MRISGFTFGRNLVKLDYPVVESITSILPLVDELIVNLGVSEDNSLEVIQSIQSPKIRILESVWDEQMRKDGLVLSYQANLALAQCSGDWAFYIQADEVVHETDLPRIETALQKYAKDEQILGLMFRYYHFDGDYWSLNPWRYRKEIRVIRNDGRSEVCGDACGFHTKADRLFFKDGPKSRWAWSGAHIYHYGWVKTTPRALWERKKSLEYFYHDDQYLEKKYSPLRDLEIDYYDILKEFRGSHPAVMKNRVSQAFRLQERGNRWLNPRFYREVFRHGFKG
jgi:glycosyltransferase involved in cell wall biosynthesis